MSFETWKIEYNPQRLDEFIKNKRSDVEMLEYELKLWIGLKKENLEKHSVYLYDCWVVPETTITAENFLENKNNKLLIDGSSSPLCATYNNNEFNRCQNCPITKIHGRHCMPEYLKFVERKDIEPFIELIRDTITLLKI